MSYIGLNQPQAVVDPNSIAPEAYAGRNLLINGDMSVWQRGTGFFTTGAYTADRWKFFGAGTQIGRAFRTQGTGLRIFGASGTAIPSLTQFIEDARKFSGKTYTMRVSAVSFDTTDWHYRMYIDYGTGGSTAEIIEDNINMDSDGVATMTFPDLSGKTFGDNDSYMQFGLFKKTIPTHDNTIIYDIQLEQGSVATEFETIDPATQLAKCQRYYWQNTLDVQGSRCITNIGIYGATTAITNIAVPPMRVTPTVVPIFISQTGMGSNPTGVGTITYFNGNIGIVFNGVGWTAGLNGRIQFDCTVDAEL